MTDVESYQKYVGSEAIDFQGDFSHERRTKLNLDLCAANSDTEAGLHGMVCKHATCYAGSTLLNPQVS